MIVERKELNFWEKTYVPALIGGVRVTLKHFFDTVFGRKKVTQQYP